MTEWLRRLRGFLLVIAFLSAFLYIFSLNFRQPGRMDMLQRAIVETLSAPILYLGTVSSTMEDLFGEYLALRNLRHENQELKGRLAVLDQKVTDYQEAYVENLRLRRLLDFKSTITAETLAAQVVLHDLTGWFQTIMIDKGFKENVAPDMAVVNDEGVVGRIFDVSDHHARVLLITDPGSSVDAIVQRNRVRGILAGKDSTTCILKYVRGNVDVQVGDLIITSGKDGVFPKGLRLGTVQGIFKDPVDLFQKIEIKPLIRLNALEELLIIRKDLTPPEAPGGN